MTRRHASLSLIMAALLLAAALPALAQNDQASNSPLLDLLQSDGATREQMAMGLLRALEVAELAPPACVPGLEVFDDVPASSPFCAWIEELVRRGITAGCGGNNYCPSAPVSRAQMAVFLVRSIEAAQGLFAVVNSDGTLDRGRGVVSTQHLGVTGSYEIIFDTDVTGCAYVGTVGNPSDGNPPRGFLVTALRVFTTTGVFIETRDVSDVLADRNFHLHVVC